MIIEPMTLQELIEGTKDLPTMPDAAIKVMRECDSPTGSAQNVANHLSRDQGLAAKILRLSNSSYYGLSGEVSDLQQSVIVLGMRSVRNLAVVASTYPWLSQPLAGYALAPGSLWEHSIAVAVGAQLLARHTRTACPETSFTAGLLHDVGKVVLSAWLENKLELTIKLAIRDSLTFCQAERKVLGYDHQEVGAELARKWQLPEVFCATMRHHHDPDPASEFRDVIDCVHVADYLTMSIGYGLGGDGMRYELDECAFNRLGLTSDSLDVLAMKFVEGVDQFNHMLSELAEAA